MIHYHVEMEGLHEIEFALGMVRDKSKMVLRTAINNAAREVAGRMVDEAGARYRFNKSDFREANSMKKATTGNLAATITAKGPANELLKFHVRPGKLYPGGKGAPGWVRARVKRSSPFTKMALRPDAAGDKHKAFVVRFDSGHLSLVQRVPGTQMEDKHLTKKYGMKEGKHWKKERIRTLFSLHTPYMEGDAYRKEIADDMYDILQRNIQTQIQRYLGGSS